MTKFLSQKEAIALDEAYFTECSYTVDQLMELAGQSVAHVAYSHFTDCKSVIVICGPGNNGGDGLVAARHLHFMKKNVQIFLPKPGKSQLLQNLVKQMEMLHIPIIASYDSFDIMVDAFSKADLILDGIFGHSFHPPANPQFASIIEAMKKCGKPIMSIDIPSGWDVEKGDEAGEGINPEVLISLSAPKLCASFFKGHHYLGGHFVPEYLQERHELKLPDFPGSALYA
eukprot:MONOS_7135.1-p1 / transcript=MONOS_7135.1 / gene=MONOS_7135 / organism=Monocercomonoides_exilis_PA203 / gene_product=RecName / transcript_product=RecName / location=Mono_scaffold00237:48644-49852(+) / protein_length=227 / sequence_SO=supercontig / SO=protein_coding / is_pseudo=false